TPVGVVDPALLDRAGLPEPPAGPLIFARLRGAGAGLAADRGIAALVERVDRQPVLADEGPDLVPAPTRQRSDLGDPAVGWIRRHHGDPGTRLGLLPSHAGDPGVVTGQGADQRPRLAHLAAVPAQLDRVVEEVRPVLADHLRHLGRVGRLDLEPDR